VLEICINVSILIGCNIKYVITGLYNGAMGTVVRFLFKNHPPPSKAMKPFSEQPLRDIPIVLVQMDATLNYSCLADTPNVVPIKAVTSHLWEKVSRIQLPLAVAHASTIHSVQGLTAEYGIVLEPPTTYNAQGLTYVACSRPRRLEDLWLLGPVYKRHFEYGRETYKKIAKEYERLAALHPSA